MERQYTSQTPIDVLRDALVVIYIQDGQEKKRAKQISERILEIAQEDPRKMHDIVTKINNRRDRIDLILPSNE